MRVAHRFTALLSTTFLVCALPLTAAAPGPQPQGKESQADHRNQADSQNQADRDKKPTLTIKATPPISFSPATIRVSATLVGGPDDYEELYCPTVEWDWGDDTTSENAVDCDPFQPGVSKITRRFSASHVYQRAERYRVVLRLKRGSKTLISANTTIQVRPGVRDMGPY